ncbi:MAG TPA: SDR family oxidoreductase [Marmoricola sp.]|nr:SDR family oxidoreductase [Marmoricola sp.]
MSSILITGASSGLGAEMARQFAALGYDLGLCARRTANLESLRAEIAADYPECEIVLHALDVTDDAAVFDVFRSFQKDFGTLDRIIINAGLGKGQPLGTGRYDANRETAMTNFVGALAQTEAAMEIFREQDNGHLVMISSLSAVRGMPKNLTTYAATKIGVAYLAEGLRAELVGKNIDITVLYPGYIASEMNAQVPQKTRLMATTEEGVRAMVSAIEKRKASAIVPTFPWVPLSFVMRHAPLRVLRRLI